MRHLQLWRNIILLLQFIECAHLYIYKKNILYIWRCTLLSWFSKMTYSKGFNLLKRRTENTVVMGQWYVERLSSDVRHFTYFLYGRGWCHLWFFQHELLAALRDAEQIRRKKLAFVFILSNVYYLALVCFKLRLVVCITKQIWDSKEVDTVICYLSKTISTSIFAHS